MSEIPFRSGKHFQAVHLAKSSVPGLIAAAVDIAYLAAIMQFGADEWWALMAAVLFATCILTPLGQLAARRMDRTIARVLESELDGSATAEDRIAAYAQASELPLKGMLWYFTNWILAAIIVPPFMIFWLGSLSTFSIVCIVVAALTGGLSVAPFVYYSLRSLVKPLQEFWGPQVGAEAREENTVFLSLTHKIRFPVIAISTATVVFVCLLAYSLAGRPVELQDLRVKQAYVGYAAAQIVASEATPDAPLEDDVEASPAPTSDDVFNQLVATAQSFAAAEEIVLLEPETGRVLAGSATLLGHEMALVLASPAGGDSSEFGSDSSFAWVALPDGSGRVLVAATQGSELAGTNAGAVMIFVVLLIGALGFALGLSHLIVQDIIGSASEIKDQAGQIAAGNLQHVDVVESEDELGDLVRTFSKMRVALRDTVSSVSSASGRVDHSAASLAEIGGDVGRNNREQLAGIEQATSHVAGIDHNVSQITEASHALSGSVEEASSSVLELGAAGEELHSTAQALNQQVSEVTSSIEQMVRSVNTVGEHTEGLTDAVSETSSSMSEMTRSMREVEGHATETAKLSLHVIELADSGREQVQETITGMDHIREATETADQVIQGLTGRMSEIGAIVDVIDDVADETNLLALNAAIIAAQSGEQGRAFSVVADEIKDLADRVLSSTKEIGSLISSVQNESAAAARAISRGTESVQGGVDLSAEAGVALEEITTAARDSGGRIQEIVAAVREQAKAAGHVEQLMERVSTRVDEIRESGLEQQRGNEVVMRGASVMRDVAQQTQRTTEEQSSGAGRIRDSMESVRDAVEHIHHALQEQGNACNAALSFLQEVFGRTQSNDESAEQLQEAASAMKRQAEVLRDDVRRFRIE
jgi:methyl-accepting chemotaxis protein